MARWNNTRLKRNTSNLSYTSILIWINIIIFFAFSVLIAWKNDIISWIVLQPSVILTGGKMWTLITSMFMHGSFVHLFANMFSLFFIGNSLEKIIGKKRFFWAYIISGLVGGIFYIIATMIFGTTNVPAVGASGAIFGLLGMLALLIPYSRISLLMGPLILIILEFSVGPFLPISILPFFNTIANILFFIMVFSIFSFNKKIRKIAVPLELPMWFLPIIAIIPLSIISFFIPLPIGNSAHLGGLVVGLIYGFYLKRKFPRKTAMIGKYFSR